MRPTIVGAELYTTCPREQLLVVIRFNVTLPPFLRPYYENMCTCFSKEAGSLTTYGYVLSCSQTVYIHPYSLNTTIAFYCVLDVAVFFLFEGMT